MSQRDELIDILLRLEQRITNIENFINKYDFTELKPHEHHTDGSCYLTSPPQYKCKLCGEFYT